MGLLFSCIVVGTKNMVDHKAWHTYHDYDARTLRNGSDDPAASQIKSERSQP